jgi:hypothetical protein
MPARKIPDSGGHVSTISRMVFAGCLVATAMTAPSAAYAQVTSAEAPVSNQIINAKRVFVSNAGSESYGAEGYFRLTKYDGGPDRAYHQLFSALRSWGRFVLTDAPADADVVLAIRFTNPIVDKVQSHNVINDPLVYDPQIALTITDPKTRVVLWSLTEHIEPARGDDENNRNFDRAIGRLVDRTRSLMGDPTSVATVIPPWTTKVPLPAGALEYERLQSQAMHAAIGATVGFAAGVIVALNVGTSTCTPSPTCTTAQGAPTLGHFLLSTSGGTLLGGVIGWFWR